MASITNMLHCCDDCASAIANGDTSGLDYYGDEYRAKWEAGVEENSKGYIGNPVITCNGEECEHETRREFMCDWCGRNVYSHKFKLELLN